MKNEFEIISKIFKQVINNRSLYSLIAYTWAWSLSDSRNRQDRKLAEIHRQSKEGYQSSWTNAWACQWICPKDGRIVATLSRRQTISDDRNPLQRRRHHQYPNARWIWKGLPSPYETAQTKVCITQRKLRHSIKPCRSNNNIRFTRAAR